MKNRIFQTTVVTLLILCSLICFAYASEGKYLAYPCVKQKKTNWCWAASAENSVRYEMSVSRTQSSAVQHIKGSLINWYPNVCGTINDIEEAAEYISEGTESYTGVNYPRSFDKFRYEISRYDNVSIAVAGYYNTDNVRTGGHAVTIDGYAMNNRGNFITYYDPGDGTDHICTYTQFCDGSYNGRKYDGICYNDEY